MRELERLERRFAGHVPGLLGARHSYAVLCPLVETAEGLSLLFEVRSASLRRQPGEVCFPGGQAEPGEDAAACALRETEEELGLVSAAGFGALRPSPAEVAEVFTAPLSFFRQTPPQVYAYDLVPTEPENFPYDDIGVGQDYRWSRGRVEVPVWYWHRHAIWGMTARAVEAFLKFFEA